MKTRATFIAPNGARVTIKYKNTGRSLNSWAVRRIARQPDASLVLPHIPVVLGTNDLLIDGAHRLAACEALNIVPSIVRQ